MVSRSFRIRLAPDARMLTPTVSIPPPLPPMRALFSNGRSIPRKFRFTDVRTAQCTRNRGREFPGSAPQPAHRITKREREGVH
jgi:hypothetical protein